MHVPRMWPYVGAKAIKTNIYSILWPFSVCGTTTHTVPSSHPPPAPRASRFSTAIVSPLDTPAPRGGDAHKARLVASPPESALQIHILSRTFTFALQPQHIGNRAMQPQFIPCRRPCYPEKWRACLSAGLHASAGTAGSCHHPLLITLPATGIHGVDGARWPAAVLMIST